MKALSVRQPWPWAMLCGDLPDPKRVENRSWHPPWTMVGQRLLIHASRGCTRQEYEEAVQWMWQSRLIERGQCPPLKQLPRGGIVGVAVLDSTILPGGLGSFKEGRAERRRMQRRRHPMADSPWYIGGGYGLVLRDVEPCTFVECKGALGFFDVDDAIVRQAGLAP